VNHGEIYDWRCLPTNFFLLQSTGLCQHVSYNGVTWSISAEMFMYAAAPAFLWVMRRSLIGLWALVIGVCVLLSLLKINGNNWLSWTYSGGCLRAIPSFMLGCLIFGSLNTLKRLPCARPAYWAAILGFLAGCWIGLSEALLLLALFAAVAFGVAADAQKKPSAFVRVLAAGGQLTYSSYMLHPLLCMLLLNGVADHVLHAHGLTRNLMVLVAFGVVWPISYLSLMFFEKPARRWMSGRDATGLQQPGSAKVLSHPPRL
jgi:peptidoglycan/LPS O-acetylase OafA/YrhL